MMRLWANSYAKSAVAAITASGALSLLVHTGLIGAWIYATRPGPDVPPTSMEDHAYFIPPPDKKPGGGPVREVVHYIGLGDLGSGEGPRTTGDLRPRSGDERVGKASADTAQAQTPTVLPAAAPVNEDSVFTILEVDTAVVRSTTSAAPAYPLNLLAAHIMGSVAARYIVDTTGFADVESFSVIRATNPEFVAAVRDALPYMRFRPAKIGATKVRQLVEQQFSFRIDTSLADARKKPDLGAHPPD